MSYKTRVISLQRQLRIAKRTLEDIKDGARDPQTRAEAALDEMRPLGPKQPLQGLCGHERRQP